MIRGAMGVVGVTAVVLIAGCGTGGSPTPAGSSGPVSGTAGTGTTAPGAPTTSAAQALPDPAGPIAKKLCDLITPQLSDWRVQGPTLGGTALNITVHQWALGNGGLPMSARVLTDKAMIDRITLENCPDTRTQAIQALNLPNLASGILF